MTTNTTNPLTQRSAMSAATGLAAAGEASQKGPPLPWQSDPAVQDIHNAFILGWSLVELRGRIQIAALDNTKLPPAAKDGQTDTTLNTADPIQLVKGTNDRLLRASRMRTIFNRIVTLQRAKFPTSVTIGTLYDPPDQADLPYLYPPEPDYANIGINPLKDEAGQPILADFRLFETTRRAINCLTMLLVDPQESLIPNLVAHHQLRLTEEILKVAHSERTATEAKPVAHSLAATAVQACEYQQEKLLSESRPEGPQAPAYTDHGTAIATLTFLTIRLLQA